MRMWYVPDGQEELVSLQNGGLNLSPMRTQPIVLIFSCSIWPLASAQQLAQIVVRNAKVLTMRAARPAAEGFAVTGGPSACCGDT